MVATTPKHKKGSRKRKHPRVKLESKFKQLKLIESGNADIPRNWNISRVRDQLYFIGTYHQFLKSILYQFCKVNKIKVRGTKEDLIKRIWEKGFDFKDIQEFALEFEDPEPANTMKLTERIQLPYDPELQHLCRLSTKLFNEANSLIASKYENSQLIFYSGISGLYHSLKDSVNFRALPSQTSQQILMVISKNWKGFFKSMKAWREDPSKFEKEPLPPRNKKDNWEWVVIFTAQQIRVRPRCRLAKRRRKQCPIINGQKKLRKQRCLINPALNCDMCHQLLFPKGVNYPPVRVKKARLGKLNQVRIVPKKAEDCYMLDIVYEHPLPVKEVPQEWKERMVGIDLGLVNIVCMVNNIQERPILIRGGPIKAINQYYNKMRAKYQAIKDQQGIKFQTNRLKRLNKTRNNKITDIFHKISRAIINYCLKFKIGVIVIGYNKQWKTRSRMGKRNNQNFVNVPFYKLIKQIKYKAELTGIQMVMVRESHTSKCSFLDEEPIEHQERYMGQRGVYNPQTKKVMRGLFRSKQGILLNSDVNGALNILRKASHEHNALPEFSKDGIEGPGLVPISVKIAELNQFPFSELDNLNYLDMRPQKQHADEVDQTVDAAPQGGTQRRRGTALSFLKERVNNFSNVINTLTSPRRNPHRKFILD